MTTPVHILGAGPAGLSAAIVLARAGREVHLHERYETIGKRFQGDLQGLENWSSKTNVCEQLQSFGLKVNFEATPFHEVTLTDGKNSFTLNSKEPFFYLVKRGPFPTSLDTGLCQQALEHGVHLHYRSSIPIAEADIVATGPIRESIIAVDKGLAFHTDLPNMAVGIFHDDFAYQGYSYLLVAQGYGCVCTVVFNQPDRLNACFERTVELARRLVPLKLDEARPVGGMGSFSFGHPVKLENALLVGEAAGFQDLLWGFGIRTAITSGALASRSILTNQNYSKQVHEALDPILKASMVNRYLWETFKHKSRPIMPFLLNLPRPFRFSFHDLYKYSFSQRLLYPLALRYLKRHYPHSLMLKK
jgi:hypothetical protein